MHGAGEITVHHHGVGAVYFRRGANADRAFALEMNFFHRFVEQDFHAATLGHAGHGVADFRATTDGVKHAVLVFKEGQNRKQTGTAERRHAEVFRLEAKREAHALIAEEAFQIRVNALMRAEHREHFQQARREQIAPAVVGLFETGFHRDHLRAVLIEKAREARRIRRGEAADFPLHAGEVRRGIHLAARAKENAILRIEADEFDLVAQVGAGHLKNFLQHARVEKERGADIESVIAQFETAGASAESVGAFENFHPHPGGGEENGAGQPAGAGTDDDDFFAHGRGEVG